MQADTSDENMFRFSVSLDFKEDDGKGNFVTCPRDKHVFKLRCNLQKKTVICVTQTSPGRILKIERWGPNLRTSEKCGEIIFIIKPRNQKHILKKVFNVFITAALKTSICLCSIIGALDFLSVMDGMSGTAT